MTIFLVYDKITQEEKMNYLYQYMNDKGEIHLSFSKDEKGNTVMGFPIIGICRNFYKENEDETSRGIETNNTKTN